MSRRLVWRLLLASVLAALAATAVKALRGNPMPDVSRHPTVDGGHRPPVAVTPLTHPAVTAAWRAPVEGACPQGFPVKAKLTSGIFHLPGMLAYDRTHPDRCYADATSAEADGLRAAKR